MKRPHLACTVPGVRTRAKAPDLFKRLRGFLERATDCDGAYSVVIREPGPLSPALRTRLVTEGWTVATDVAWEGVPRATPGEPAARIPHATLALLLAEAATHGLVRGVLKFQFLLVDPRDGTPLPYQPDDFATAEPSAFSRAALFCHDGGESRFHLDLVFPVAGFTDEVGRVIESVQKDARVKLPPRVWSIVTPGAPGMPPARESIATLASTWVEPASPDATALLAEIVAAPADDGPRQIYADLLLAQEDPRGELITLQCELARLSPTDPRHTPLAARERELLRRHGERWARLPRKMRGTFHRGFIEEVRVTFVAQLVRHASVLRAVAPLLRRVVLDHVIDFVTARQLATIGLALNLTELALEPSGGGVLELLATSELAPTLRTLRLVCRDRRLATELPAAFASPDQWPALEVLELVGPAVTVDARTAIAHSPVGRRLHRFTVTDTRPAVPERD